MPVLKRKKREMKGGTNPPSVADQPAPPVAVRVPAPPPAATAGQQAATPATKFKNLVDDLETINKELNEITDVTDVTQFNNKNIIDFSNKFTNIDLTGINKDVIINNETIQNFSDIIISKPDIKKIEGINNILRILTGLISKDTPAAQSQQPAATPAKDHGPVFVYPGDKNNVNHYVNTDNKLINAEDFTKLITAAIDYIQENSNKTPHASFTKAINLIVEILKRRNGINGGGSGAPYPSAINNPGDLLSARPYSDGTSTAANLLSTNTASTVGMQVRSADPTASFPMTLSNRVTPVFGGPSI